MTALYQPVGLWSNQQGDHYGQLGIGEIVSWDTLGRLSVQKLCEACNVAMSTVVLGCVRFVLVLIPVIKPPDMLSAPCPSISCPDLQGGCGGPAPAPPCPIVYTLDSGCRQAVLQALCFWRGDKGNSQLARCPQRKWLCNWFVCCRLNWLNLLVAAP